MEMDDTQLVVTSLESKQQNVKEELLTKTADLKFAQKFSERVELEERIAELQARKRVVDGYFKTARKRLLSLQSRYKELVVGGRVSDSPPPHEANTLAAVMNHLQEVVLRLIHQSIVYFEFYWGE